VVPTTWSLGIYSANLKLFGYLICQFSQRNSAEILFSGDALLLSGAANPMT